jgi:alpha-L-fucosidase
VEQWHDGQWQKFGSGASIGNCRLLRGADAATGKVRVRITKAPVCPAISEIALFSDKNEPRHEPDEDGK